MGLHGRLAHSAILAAVTFGASAWWTEGDQADAFAPVAPPEAIHFAMKQNVELIGDWLDGKDLASAAETTESLDILAEIFSLAVADEQRDDTTKLRKAIERLAKLARAKDLDGSRKALDECGRLVDELAKAPAAKKSTARDPVGSASTKAVMKLMDGTYSDAKTTRSVKELEHLAFTVAETANFASHMRSDARWRSAAVEVRDAAAAVARSAADKGLQAARAELKNVYQRCEACHRAYKR
jgi:hypothetical protein